MKKVLWLIGLLSFVPVAALAAAHHGPEFYGIRIEFILFGLTLLGVALFHHKTFEVAVTGLIALLAFKLIFTHFNLVHHLAAEGRLLLNLFGLLMGFALLARHFEESKVPDELPKWLPGDWKGGFVLLVMVFVISTFLDNIAAAMIGGAMATVVYQRRVHIGYLAAIVAASNAGGAGSVVGDTTTTMMWIDGVSAKDVLHGFVGSGASLLFFGVVAAIQQQKYHPIAKEARPDIHIDWVRVLIVLMILVGAILANVYLEFPAVGVWVAILIGTFLRKTPWGELGRSLKGSLFLLSLVLCASMMPVEELPRASWRTAFNLGLVSAVFDNIPLTKLALDQGGYDWGFLAYAVGFGGSMIWFGSSAGVALSNMFPKAKSVFSWLRYGWHVAVAYIIGFTVLLLIMGWHPHAPHKKGRVFEQPQINMPPAEMIIKNRLSK